MPQEFQSGGSVGALCQPDSFMPPFPHNQSMRAESHGRAETETADRVPMQLPARKRKVSPHKSSESCVLDPLRWGGGADVGTESALK